MNRYLLSLGSNNNKTENMAKCRSLLCELYSDVIFSEMIETEAFGEGFVYDFYNQLALVETEKSIDEIKKQLKHIETKIGRQSTDKSEGLVKIDLDLLAVNNRVVKKDDFERPYLNILLADLCHCLNEQ